MQTLAVEKPTNYSQDGALLGPRSSNCATKIAVALLALNTLLFIILLSLVGGIGGHLSTVMSELHMRAKEVNMTSFNGALATISAVDADMMDTVPADLHKLAVAASVLNINISSLVSLPAIANSIASVDVGKLNTQLTAFTSPWLTSIKGATYSANDAWTWNGVASVLSAIDSFATAFSVIKPIASTEPSPINQLAEALFDPSDMHALAATCSDLHTKLVTVSWSSIQFNNYCPNDDGTAMAPCADNNWGPFGEGPTIFPFDANTVASVNAALSAMARICSALAAA